MVQYNNTLFASVVLTLAVCSALAVLQFMLGTSNHDDYGANSSDATIIRRTSSRSAAQQHFQAVHSLLDEGDHETADSYLYLLEQQERQQEQEAADAATRSALTTAAVRVSSDWQVFRW